MRTTARRLRLIAGLVVLLGFEVGAIVVLHQLGELDWLVIPWSELATWLSSSNFEDALAAVLRLVALGVAYWLLLTTGVYLLARSARIPSAIRAVEWATLPAVRRLVDGAVAVSIATTTIAGPAAPVLADDSAPTPVVIELDDEGRPVPPGAPTRRSEDRTEPGNDPGEVAPQPPLRPAGADRSGWTPRPAGAAEPGASDRADRASRFAAHADGAASVVVQRGDHLWSIACERLSRDGLDPSDEEVARYWRRVIRLNEARIRSGDPDLIHPGETILLPPTELEAP